MIGGVRDPPREQPEQAEMALKRGDKVVTIPCQLVPQGLGWMAPPLEARLSVGMKTRKGILRVLGVARPAPCPSANIERWPPLEAEVSTKQSISPPS